MLSRLCPSTRLLCRKLEFHSPVCTQVASLMRLEHPPNYDHVEFPEKRKLKFFDKVPKFASDQRPQKMMKDLALMRGPELIHNKLQYAEFGIQAIQGGRLRHGQIEAVRGIIYRNIDEKRMFAIWRIDQPWQSVTKKGQGKRMGGGKGSIDRWEFPVRPDRIILEVGGTVEFKEVSKFMEQAAHILPFKARVVTKEMLIKEKEEEERIKRENVNPFTFEYCAKKNFLGMNIWLSPYDYRWHNKYSYCEKRVCNQCGLYFPSQAAKHNHALIHRHAVMSTQAEVAYVSAVEPDSVSAILSTASSTSTTESSDDGLPVVCNLFDWLKSVFVEMK